MLSLTVILDMHVSIDGLFENRSERTTQADSLIQLAEADQSFVVNSAQSYLLSSDLFTTLKMFKYTLQQTKDPFLDADISV